jgi:hypothetical protein
LNLRSTIIISGQILEFTIDDADVDAIVSFIDGCVGPSYYYCVRLPELSVC